MTIKSTINDTFKRLPFGLALFVVTLATVVIILIVVGAFALFGLLTSVCWNEVMVPQGLKSITYVQGMYINALAGLLNNRILNFKEKSK